MNFNKGFIGGRFTHDPELQYLPNGNAVCNFSIAVNDDYIPEGVDEAYCNFFNLVIFGKRAEALCTYFKKGRPIFVEYRARQDRWEDKDTGDSRQAVKFVVDNWNFVGPKPDDAEDAPAPTGGTSTPTRDVEDDEIPF